MNLRLSSSNLLAENQSKVINQRKNKVCMSLYCRYIHIAITLLIRVLHIHNFSSFGIPVFSDCLVIFFYTVAQLQYPTVTLSMWVKRSRLKHRATIQYCDSNARPTYCKGSHTICICLPKTCKLQRNICDNSLKSTTIFSYQTVLTEHVNSETFGNSKY